MWTLDQSEENLEGRYLAGVGSPRMTFPKANKEWEKPGH